MKPCSDCPVRPGRDGPGAGGLSLAGPMPEGGAGWRAQSVAVAVCMDVILGNVVDRNGEIGKNI